MKASKFDLQERIEIHSESKVERGSQLETESDLLASELFKNITSTPIGQLLKMIGSLPEIRGEKVSNVRRQITDGQYDTPGHLDVALDRVLEELMTEN